MSAALRRATRAVEKSRVVVDTNVLRSMGNEDAQVPISRLARQALDTIRTGRIKVVYSPEIAAEWRRMARSRHASQWRAAMTTARLWDRQEDLPHEGLRLARNRVTLTRVQANAIDEDLHIIHAALNTDRAVLSHDHEVRDALRIVAVRLASLRTTDWVSLLEQGVAAIEWLKAGAPRGQAPIGTDS